jgi:hypothetical protein
MICGVVATSISGCCVGCVPCSVRLDSKKVYFISDTGRKNKTVIYVSYIQYIQPLRLLLT